MHPPSLHKIPLSLLPTFTLAATSITLAHRYISGPNSSAAVVAQGGRCSPAKPFSALAAFSQLLITR